MKFTVPPSQMLSGVAPKLALGFAKMEMVFVVSPIQPSAEMTFRRTFWVPAVEKTLEIF